jgi:hypothetical protein
MTKYRSAWLPEGHLIQDDEDFNRYVDYIHWNPDKHGLVRSVPDWPHASFHDYVQRGLCPENWGGEDPVSIEAGKMTRTMRFPFVTAAYAGFHWVNGGTWAALTLKIKYL